MSRFIGVFLIIFASAFAVKAQERHVPERAMERIHAAKMVYITDRLKLTSAQSMDFLPIYKDYEQDKRECRKKYLQKYKGMEMEDADDATSKQYIDDNLDYQQEIIQLKRKYNERFLKIISPQQLADLNEAERDFKQLLMQRLKERREGGRKWR